MSNIGYPDQGEETINLEQTAKLLARIKIGDNRTVNDEVTMDWFHALDGQVTFVDAINAVSLHRRESTDYLQPAHIVRLAKRLREDRNQGKALAALEGLGQGKYPAPRPDNFDAMAAAWNDPVEFAKQCRIYQDQLDREGYIGPAVA